MEIFNIGPLELLLIIVLALIIFGPEDLVKFSRSAGRWLYRASKSEFWKSVVGTSKEIQDLPKQIMKEAQIEETLKEFNAMNSSKTPSGSEEATILPPGEHPSNPEKEAPERKDEPPAGG
jgi:sec-independent protein translocase protein TatB